MFLGVLSPQVPFPDSLFTTATARMSLLQAWLQEAIALVPYLPGVAAQEKATSLLGARLALRSDSPTPAGATVGADADVEKLIIPVGPSSSNVKRVHLPSAGLKVSAVPYNEQDAVWKDTFAVEVNGTKLVVRRIDVNTGWTQDLVLTAAAPSSPATQRRVQRDSTSGAAE